MYVKYYQAVWLDRDGYFRVNGAISKNSAEEAIDMCQFHSAVRNGAKLHFVDEWEDWERD